MAKKNKKRRSANARNVPPLPTPSQPVAKAAPPTSHQATRETVEALVVAFVLAMLFRTFQAEAFVIPTGSMAPTLMGHHKDVYCDQCGQRFKVNSSDEGKNLSELAKSPQFRNQRLSGKQIAALTETVAGRCQNCRYPMPFTPDLPPSVPVNREEITRENSSSGDRILVNKYLYSFTDPKRWDVVVFKYPGDAGQNYIKRLVGLPGETLRIYQGDVYTKEQEERTGDSAENAPDQILRKPADKVLAMRQLVHDTQHDPVSLHLAGWPLRWEPEEKNGWRVETHIDGKNVRQAYLVGAEANANSGPFWLTYAHRPATPAAWRIVREKLANNSPLDGVLEDHPDRDRRQLITDFNSYNTEVPRYALRQAADSIGGGQTDIQLAPTARGWWHGIHWVGDLSIDLEIEVISGEGDLLIDLIEAGQHFRCKIDTTTGQADLELIAHGSGEPLMSFGSTKTSLIGPGKRRVRFANVDDQLLLWIDDDLIPFENDGSYDAEAAFGQRGRLAPKTDETDPGDLAPVRIGSQGVELAITRLSLYRDLYYIANKWTGRNDVMTDYPLTANRGLEMPDGGVGRPWLVPWDPRLWPAIANRRSVQFEIGDDQLFVMGDNSPSSKDCRLWTSDETPNRPGGLYLERSLLTGKAVCVYWPHALVSIPTPFRGTRIPVIPNLGDIRLVR